MIPPCPIRMIYRKKEDNQQSKTIGHLRTRIKLLEKSQNDLYKTINQNETGK